MALPQSRYQKNSKWLKVMDKRKTRPSKCCRETQKNVFITGAKRTLQLYYKVQFNKKQKGLHIFGQIPEWTNGADSRIARSKAGGQ